MSTTRTANGVASPTDMTGEVLAEAARRMVPVLTGKLLTAIADQAVARVDGLADRLDDYRDHGPARRDEPDDGPDTTDDTPRPSVASTALSFLAEQLRTVLAIVVRLAAQALEMLRRATERLRARRAPEGIDVEAEALQDEDDHEDDDLEGEYDLEYDDEDDHEDDREERAAG